MGTSSISKKGEILEKGLIWKRGGGLPPLPTMVCYLILFRVFLVRNMEFHCIFQSILDCSDTQELVEAQLTLTHQDKVKQCSERNDNFYETLDPNIALYYHQNFYFRYTYNHIERYLKRKNQNQKVSCVKRTKQSSTTFFDFKKNFNMQGSM